MKRWLAAGSGLALLGLLSSSALPAQGVTTGSINGKVANSEGAPLAGARVTAVHGPSGTTYWGSTRADGRVALAGLRVGGPYRVIAAAIGFEAGTRDDIFITLGVATDLQFALSQAVVTLEEVRVTATGETVFSSERTGAATSIPREVLGTLPTISGRLEDLTRLTPQVRGTSYAGMDNRLNNITVDGSYFNNAFGLAGSPGERTNVAPISLAAIEQVQVNIAPYDVRQGHFIGAGVNTVTRSGTNEFTGSLGYGWRSEGLVGTETGPGLLTVNPGTFTFNRYGGYLGGPIVKNKLFFFASYEHDGLTSPGTTFRTNTGGETVEGSVTRVLKSDMDALHDFLLTNFNYEAGPYEGYDFETPATRFIGKLDYNLNDRNKFSLRYNHLDSFTDVLESNSFSLGVLGNRRTNLNSINFRNSNYQILENIRSVVGEWNSALGQNLHNNLIIGYSQHDESRAVRNGDVGDPATWFPLVDIQKDNLTYTSFGFEPFTPNNELRYNSLQLQNNLTLYGTKHDWTFGVSGERYRSHNVFFQGAQSIYVYNSLEDFYTDANGYVANPSRTTSPVSLRRFQVAWSNIPGLEKPIQPLRVWYAGVYAQDEWRVSPSFKLTMGLRVDMPFFQKTGFTNPQANALTFRDESGALVHYRTQQLPGRNPNLSPRVGFNWDVSGQRTTQVRGGTGIFSGPPLYVWISNQIGNNGMLTGFQQIDNTNTRPFNPDPNAYKPTTISGAPASSYALAFTDPDFKFPQVWRTNVGVDHRLPFGIVGTAEFIYNRDMNGIYYINANLALPQSRFTGADTRPRWFASCPTSSGGSGTCARINNVATSAVVMKNQSVGRAWNIGGALERRFQSGLFAKVAYNYGEAKNTVDPGSIALGTWQGIAIVNDPNNPGLGYSFNSPGHRVFATVAYRRDFFKFGTTTISAFWNSQTIGNTSYLYGGDLNLDGNAANDLIYIPRDASEMNFQQYTQSASATASARTFTPAEQAAAWDAYIEQDSYLSKKRGEYAARNAVFLPMVKRLDLSVSQDLHTLIGGRRNALQFRADFLNFGNLLSHKWGASQRLVSNQPLLVPSSSQSGVVTGCTGPAVAGPADACGRAQHRLRNFEKEGQFKLMGESGLDRTFEQTSSLGDVWQLQFMLRYIFN